MQLKKLIFLEGLILIVILCIAIGFFWLIPSLQSSNQNSIPIYGQVIYPQNILTVEDGASIRRTFNYSTYDPSIIVITLTPESCTRQGYLDIYCNYRLVSSTLLTLQNKSVTLNMFSTSGFDWVEKPSSMGGVNELLFESAPKEGYTGTLAYQITLRGSR
jgi:hypothetical protein